jgi:regulator of protease activity HflC (stomatin/prohibitin superfamily)
MTKRLLSLIAFIVVGIFVTFLALDAYYVVDAKEIAIVQYLNGSLEVVNQAGPHLGYWGKITKYPKLGQFWFSASQDQGDAKDQSMRIRFNDGAHGFISGSAAFELPITEPKKMIELHTLYGSSAAVEHALIRTVFEKSIYMTGPLMSSKEVAGERRNDLLKYIEDQVLLGVYKTQTRNIQDKDPLTGNTRTIAITEIVKDDAGTIQRQDESPLGRFGIRVSNLSINKIAFEQQVEEQIQAQQRALQQVQLAIAKAKEAEQAAITAAKDGEAKAATAKWEQEVIKAKEVTFAQQKLEVAKLDRLAAEQKKAKDILEGEGESTKRRLIMSADGALAQKLEAYVKVQQSYAENFGKYQGNWVPSIVMGGGDGKNGFNGASHLIEMLSAKTAQDLAIPFNFQKK